MLQKEEQLAFRASYILIISQCEIIVDTKWRPNRQNRCFVGFTVDEWNFVKKFWKKMVAIWSWYFHPVFERMFSGFSFSRSSRQKVQVLLQQKICKMWRPNAYAKDYINAYASHRIKKTRWHTRRARMRNAMRSITSFSIIKSRKLGENCFFHRVRNCFLEGIFLIFAWIENRFFCYAKEEC